MRFNRSKPAPDYLSNRFRMRLLSLVAALCLLVVAADFALRPQNWYWMLGRPAEETRGDARLTPEQEAEIARSRTPAEGTEETPLREGEFRIPAGEQTPENNAPEPLTPEEEIAVTAPGSAVRINPLLLKKITDNTASIRLQEAEAYYGILALVRDLPPQQLREASQTTLPFTALVDNPELYRGQPLTLRGTLQLVYPLPAVPNTYQIGETWEAWVVTTDSGNRPYRVVALNIPPDFPVGEFVQEGMPVELTGYFFKSYGYPRQDGSSQVAPLLLVRDIEQSTAQASSTMMPQVSVLDYAPYVLGGLAVLAVGLGLVIWRVRTSDRHFERNQLDRLTRASAEDLEALKGLPTTSPEEFLQQLTRQESAAPRQGGQATPK